MSDFELPIFCLIEERPVMAVSTDDGGMDILAWNWDTGEFERDMSLLTEVVLGDADHITEAEFLEYVQLLRDEG